MIVEKIRNKNKIGNYIDIYNKILENNKIENKFIEFHPSDVCNYKCSFCSYREKNSLSGQVVYYPFRKLQKLIELSPSAITIVGGGEPTLYYDKETGKDFNDLISYLKEKIKIPLGLITNGSNPIKLETLSKLDWIRISLDYFDSDKYFEEKGFKFDMVLDNISTIYKSDCSIIGIGFLVNSENISQILDCTKYFFKKYPNINIQFRTTCSRESCDCPSIVYKKENIRTKDLSKEYHESMKSLRKSYLTLPNAEKKYIDEQTNLLEIMEDVKKVKIQPIKSEFCYTSLFRWILRPNGEVYPCVMCATNGNFRIGNLFDETFEELQNEAFKFYKLKKCKTTDSCCKLGQGKQNQVFEEILKMKIIEKDYFI